MEGQSPEPDAISPDEYSRLRGDYILSGGGVPPAGAIPPPSADGSREDRDAGTP